MSQVETVNETLETTSTLPKLKCIYFYIGGCNLRCRHCWVGAGYQKDETEYPYALDFNLFKSIIEQAKPLGLNSVKLTGGEPLVHPSILDLLGLIKEEQLHLVVETNGTLMTPTIAKLISECVTPFVSVSIDGSEAETHEWLRKVPGCFEKSLSGIRILVDAGFKPQMIMMVMPHNKHQMESAVRMAEALGCGSVKFNLVNPTSRGMLVRDKGQTLSLEEYIEVGEWVERELVPSSSIGIYYSHPFAFVPLSNMYGRQKDPRGACGISGVIGVLSDGNYALCGIGESVKDLVFGNATEVPLAKVWAENPVILDIRKKFPRELKGLCGRCAMLDTCLGFCIAHNYFASKDLWSGFWYCHEAHQKGLFPVNRLRPDKNLV